MDHASPISRSIGPDCSAVQNLVEEARKLVDEKAAQINRLTDHLRVYFPQMLDWFGRLDSDPFKLVVFLNFNVSHDHNQHFL